MKPIIGLTVKYSDESGIGTLSEQGVVNEEWQMISNGYIRAVTEAGGIPIIIPVYDDAMMVEPIIGMLDGILFTGGSDINPSYYQEALAKERRT